MSLKVKKKYYVVLISFAVLLILSVVTIGVLSSQLLKKESDEDNYTIGSYELKTLPNECNKDLTLSNYIYTSNSASEQKVYVYATSTGEELIATYIEYLVSEKNFEQVDSDSSYTYTLSNEDVINISFESDDNSLTVVLNIYYHS